MSGTLTRTKRAIQLRRLGDTTSVAVAPVSCIFSASLRRLSIIELAKVAAAEGAIYESHIRAESSRGVGVHKAVDEVIEIARAADIAAHIAHIKVWGKGVWGESGNIVNKIVTAGPRGSPSLLINTRG